MRRRNDAAESVLRAPAIPRVPGDATMASMARLVAIDHVQLGMPAGGPDCEERARAFWSGLLGLAEVPRPADARRAGLWFAAGCVHVHLGVEEDFRPAALAHPAFVATDLEALLELCRAAGLTVTPAAPLDGRERAHVFDPFGNRVELMAPAT